MRADAAAIILRSEESETGLAVAGSHGLSPQYADYLNEVQPIQMGQGVSGRVAEARTPIFIEDVLEDPVFGPWRELAVREHYRSMVSVPMLLEGERVLGVLNAYGAQPGPWSEHEITILSSLANHAAIGVLIAQLLDESRRQIQGLSLLVGSLRAQSHEHANRLHAISGLLSLDEVDRARRLIATVEDRYHSVYGRVTATIANPTIAGFLVAECAVAGQSGVDMRVDARSRLEELPESLSELDAITVLGNLLHNAVDAVLEGPEAKPRVSVRVAQSSDELLMIVRDWGPGITLEEVANIFDRDHTTKRGHAGIGLFLVRGIVRRAGGSIDLEHPRGGGVQFVVRVPQ